MDLFIHLDDFKGVFDEIRSQYHMTPEYDGGTLFAYKYGTLKKGQMEFGLGNYDTALFYHHHPYDSDSYQLFSVRSLYEELVLLKKNRTPKEDIIYDEGWNGQVVINVGKMIERREQQREEIIKLNDSSENLAQQQVQQQLYKSDFYELLRTKNEQRPLVLKENEPGELAKFLKSSADEGNDYVAYDPERPISIKELRCFELYIDAHDYCKEGRFDQNKFFFTSIDEMQIEIKYSTNINSLEKMVGNLESRMRKADWFYDFSDDFQVWSKGDKEFKNIIQDLEHVGKQTNGIQIAMELWQKHNRNHLINPPDFIKEAYRIKQAEILDQKNDLKNEIKRPKFLKRFDKETQRKRLKLR